MCKGGPGTLLLWHGPVFHVRDFGCIKKQILNTYSKSAQCTKSGPFRVKLTKTLVTLIEETKRDRLKSAPYLRLKNIQGTTIGNICKKFFFQKNYF